MRNARIAKNKSVAVNNGHALIALAHEMWQCVAADEICVKGVRGCFPDKVFDGFRALQKSAENASRPLDAQLAKVVFQKASVSIFVLKEMHTIRNIRVAPTRYSH